ncbi:MAG: LysR family transcriptional regulator [Betaproteobacteria bacterium]|nr:LysR family transcriptional regulator [Betaproteobacteria bacterium]
MMDLAKLGRFVKVAELGSLTKAAMMLDTTQSSLSLQISALERDFGGRLFHRTGRGVALTELGERILQRARGLLTDAEQLANEIRSSAGKPYGKVAIGILPSTAHLLVTQLYRQARERYPHVLLHIFEGSSGQLDEWVSKGLLDMAILYRYGKSSARAEQSLAVVESCLVGRSGDAITRSSTVKFVRLDRLLLCLPGAPNGLRVALDQIARSRRIALSVAMEADSIPIQKQFALDGHGYAILAMHAVSREVERGSLRASRIVSPGLDRTITLATTTERPLTLAAREAAKLLRVIVDEQASKGGWQHRRS